MQLTPKAFLLFALIMFGLGYGAAYVTAPGEEVAIEVAEEGPVKAPTKVVDEVSEKAPEPKTNTITLSIRKGDTLISVLNRAGAVGMDAYAAAQSMEGVYDVRSIRAGQEVTLAFEETPEASRLSEVTIPRRDRKIHIFRNANGDFVAEEKARELVKSYERRAGSIRSSMLAAAQDMDLPTPVVYELIRLYSYNVDFQRDIQSGDRVDVAYEVFEDKQGNLVRYGNVIYARLVNGGGNNLLYRYDKGDLTQYFDEEGRSIQKSLMRTPVPGARISSNYGMRKHPILGYSKMHKGVDFAAPTGTPIYAAGDGRVVEVGRKGGYGNYMRIHHGGGYATAYAHISKFARGVRRGTRVKQGDVIAYVGNTGRSTGPHLHFEILRNGVQTNPMKVKTKPQVKLAGRALEEFKREQARINALVAELPTVTQVAMHP